MLSSLEASGMWESCSRPSSAGPLTSPDPQGLQQNRLEGPRRKHQIREVPDELDHDRKALIQQKQQELKEES